ncbi:UPF0149 family protein [Vibrio sp. RC27]
MNLTELFAQLEPTEQLMNESSTRGFITAITCAPMLLPAEEWLPFLWGGTESAPFSDGAQFEQYCQTIVELWNNTREQLLEQTWQWPNNCLLDEEQLVNQATQDFCEGFLQGWQLTQDDWQNLVEEESEDNALIGGILLTISMLYDPETAIATLEQSDAAELSQFEEIYNAIPRMVCGLTLKGLELEQAQ